MDSLLLQYHPERSGDKLEKHRFEGVMRIAFDIVDGLDQIRVLVASDNNSL